MGKKMMCHAYLNEVLFVQKLLQCNVLLLKDALKRTSL